MSELQQYYDAFRTSYWAHPDADKCRCHGRGWVLSEVDTWHECPCHKGQPHPDDEGCECDPCDVAPVAEPAVLSVATDEVGDDDIAF